MSNSFTFYLLESFTFIKVGGVFEKSLSLLLKQSILFETFLSSSFIIPLQLLTLAFQEKRKCQSILNRFVSGGGMLGIRRKKLSSLVFIHLSLALCLLILKA